MTPLTNLFKALSDTSRLRILNLLFESGELCVCDIESTLGFTQTKVSRHMAYLRRAGLVQDRKHGRWVLYAIAEPGTEEQRILVRSVQDILKSQKKIKKDQVTISRNISKGCCTTPSLLNTSSGHITIKGNRNGKH